MYNRRENKGNLSTFDKYKSNLAKAVAGAAVVGTALANVLGFGGNYTDYASELLRAGEVNRYVFSITEDGVELDLKEPIPLNNKVDAAKILNVSQNGYNIIEGAMGNDYWSAAGVDEQGRFWIEPDADSIDKIYFNDFAQVIQQISDRFPEDLYLGDVTPELDLEAMTIGITATLRTSDDDNDNYTVIAALEGKLIERDNELYIEDLVETDHEVKTKNIELTLAAGDNDFSAIVGWAIPYLGGASSNLDAFVNNEQLDDEFYSLDLAEALGIGDELVVAAEAIGPGNMPDKFVVYTIDAGKDVFVATDAHVVYKPGEPKIPGVDPTPGPTDPTPTHEPPKPTPTPYVPTSTPTSTPIATEDKGNAGGGQEKHGDPSDPPPAGHTRNGGPKRTPQPGSCDEHNPGKGGGQGRDCN